MKRTAGLYIAWLVAVVLLIFAATGRNPYNFYTVLRWICCAVFVYSAFTAREKNRVAWTWIFGALAALYNPIFHVHLDRSTWTTVNWFTVAAIAVATVFFWPGDKGSTVSLFEEALEILPVSRRTVAREWLIFLAVLPLGFTTCFFLGFYREELSSLSGAYDDFWNAHFGLGRASSLALWIAPYLTLILIRSILWSISTLWPGRSLKREIFYSLLVVYLIAVVFIGTVVIQNSRRQAAQTKAALDSLFNYLGADDLKRITLFDAEVFPGTSYYIDRIYGRIRNDLSRPVYNVQLRASIYNAAGQLIEVKDFALYTPALYPGLPVSFNEEVGFYNLPTGYRCWVNVVAAKYLW